MLKTGDNTPGGRPKEAAAAAPPAGGTVPSPSPTSAVKTPTEESIDADTEPLLNSPPNTPKNPTLVLGGPAPSSSPTSVPKTPNKESVDADSDIDAAIDVDMGFDTDTDVDIDDAYTASPRTEFVDIDGDNTLISPQTESAGDEDEGEVPPSSPPNGVKKKGKKNKKNKWRRQGWFEPLR